MPKVALACTLNEGCVLLVLALTTTSILTGCDMRSSKVSKSEFPACAKTGHAPSAQELVDIAVKDQMRMMRATKQCPVEYSSLEQFYKKNPHCCDLNRGYLFSHEPIDVHDLGDDGWLVGNVSVRYYCGSNDRAVGQYRDGNADITSCGIITESTAGSASIFGGKESTGHYPK